MARALIKLYTHKRLPYIILYTVYVERLQARHMLSGHYVAEAKADGARKKFSAAEPRHGVY
jgi:hypothetical protein